MGKKNKTGQPELADKLVKRVKWTKNKTSHLTIWPLENPVNEKNGHAIGLRWDRRVDVSKTNQ